MHAQCLCMTVRPRLLLPQDEPCVPGSPMKKGAKLRLQHTATRKWLHSHHYESPLSANQEVRVSLKHMTTPRWRVLAWGPGDRGPKHLICMCTIRLCLPCSSQHAARWLWSPGPWGVGGARFSSSGTPPLPDNLLSRMAACSAVSKWHIGVAHSWRTGCKTRAQLQYPRGSRPCGCCCCC